MRQIVQLSPQDDIASIRAQIDAAEFAHIVLVVPRKCRALETQSGMQLLRRAVDNACAQVALVVHDNVVGDRAKEYGFSVFASVLQAQQAQWAMRPSEHDSRLFMPSQSPASNEPQRFVLTPEMIKQWRSVIALFMGALLVLCAAAFLIVPTARVYIVPASVALTMTTDILADPSITQINIETRSIPARRLTQEISGTAQLNTTTTKNLPDARATGTVIFTNVRSEETIIPQGTVVKTSAGVPIRFSTTITGTIPAGVNSRVEVPIQAVDPGPSGNVKELAINTVDGSLNLEARVINLKPTVSGNVRPVKVVTADNKKKLDDLLLSQLQQQAPIVLLSELKPGEFTPPDSVLVDTNNKIFDHVVDDPAEILYLKTTADLFGLAVNQSDLESLVSSLMQRQMQAGYQLLPNSTKVEPLSGGKYQGIALRMPIRTIGYATPQIDSSKVARALQGKSVVEAKIYLSNAIQLAQQPVISTFPFAWPRMPWLSFRIAVFVEPQGVSN